MIGFHVGSTSDLPAVVKRYQPQGVNWYQIYLSNPKRADSPKKPLIPYANYVVHAPFITNVYGSKMYNWTRDYLRNSVRIMEELGIKHLVVHPGSTLGARDAWTKCRDLCREFISYSSLVKLCLETSCGSKNGNMQGTIVTGKQIGRAHG